MNKTAATFAPTVVANLMECTAERVRQAAAHTGVDRPAPQVRWQLSFADAVCIVAMDKFQDRLPRAAAAEAAMMLRENFERLLLDDSAVLWIVGSRVGRDWTVNSYSDPEQALDVMAVTPNPVLLPGHRVAIEAANRLNAAAADPANRAAN